MAEFNEEKAKEIAEKHNYPKAYINKWRFRNSIPDKYFEKVESVAPQDKERVLSILNSKKINNTTLSKNTGLSRSYFDKLIKNIIELSDENAIKIKKQLSYIRIDVSTLISILEQSRNSLVKEREFMSILNKDTFFEKFALGEIPANRISSYRNKKRIDFPIELKNEMLQNLLVFRLELSI